MEYKGHEIVVETAQFESANPADFTVSIYRNRKLSNSAPIHEQVLVGEQPDEAGYAYGRKWIDENG
jgi:hypothetical protein